MRVKRVLSQVLAGIILLLFTTVIAACGSSSSAAGSTATGTTTATSCISQATGTIKSINSTTLLVTNLQGKDVQATFTSKTTFIHQATLKPADLKAGMLVSVIVTQNADSTYSARTVGVRTSVTRQGGFTSGSKLCNGQRPRGTRTPGAFGGPGFGSGTPGTGQSRQTINGTVSQMNAGSLTVTDTSGNDFTVALTPATRISMQQTVSASDLHVGEAVTITGSANSQGVINASGVSILQGLPNRSATPTPGT
jgi:Domain of unknown function (DUF5666)